VSSWDREPDALVLTIRSADRFGDNGLVGAMFVRRTGDVAQLENFLLSCRVFSRGIEQACLSAVLQHARDIGLEAVRGAYRPTQKNQKVAELYPRYGFRLESDDGVTKVFRHDLQSVVEVPSHIRLSARFERRGRHD
jgi:FkbH-like protein